MIRSTGLLALPSCMRQTTPPSRAGIRFEIIMNHDTISIFFAVDPPWFQHLCVLIVSILECNPDEHFAFHIMTNQNVVVEKEKIISLKNVCQNCEFHFISMDETQFAGLPISRLPHQIYYRLVIPDIAPELERAIYIDADIVCNIALREIWETPLDGYYVAGVEDMLSRSHLPYLAAIGLPPAHKYINAGMLVMNLKKWRDDDAVRRCFEYVHDMADVLKYGDQDAINHVFQGRIKLLDQKWNYTTCDSDYSENRPKQQMGHFTGKRKPWKFFKYCTHMSSRLYFKHLKKTPYRNFMIKHQVFGILRLLEGCEPYIERKLRKLRIKFGIYPPRKR